MENVKEEKQEEQEQEQQQEQEEQVRSKKLYFPTSAEIFITVGGG